MKCIVCDRGDEETLIYKAIYGNEVVDICEGCAKKEGAMIIHKPTAEQLDSVNKRVSVRERMERLAGVSRGIPEPLPREQITTGAVKNNMEKLRYPSHKQGTELLIENYYWELQMARRRRKSTLRQVSEETGIGLETLEKL